MTDELYCCRNCGAPAKIRYRRPTWFVECKKKCGNRTRYYSDWDQEQDPFSKKLAITEWQKKNDPEEDDGK